MRSRTEDERCVVNVLTGFLGSGKTTLLKRLLAGEAFAQCAVLVNELGEIPLDHLLLDRIDHETVVLKGGCICCGVRSDLAGALLRLYERRSRNDIPAFDRVVIETTGMADPVPVINTILSDPVLRHHFRVGTVVTTVDAVHGMQQLQRHPESRKQAAVADRIVITKADLVSDDDLEVLRAALVGTNPYCRIFESRNDASEADIGMSVDLGGGSRAHEVAGWFTGRVDEASAGRALFRGAGRALGPAHDRIDTLSLALDEPLDWTAFGVWLSMLLHRYGADILRLKGILDLHNVDVPTVIHGVQHLLHPPVHLAAWPDGQRRSRLVLIGKLPSVEALKHSLECFNVHGH